MGSPRSLAARSATPAPSPALAALPDNSPPLPTSAPTHLQIKSQRIVAGLFRSGTRQFPSRVSAHPTTKQPPAPQKFAPSPVPDTAGRSANVAPALAEILPLPPAFESVAARLVSRISPPVLVASSLRCAAQPLLYLAPRAAPAHQSAAAVKFASPTRIAATRSESSAHTAKGNSVHAASPPRWSNPFRAPVQSNSPHTSALLSVP